MKLSLITLIFLCCLSFVFCLSADEMKNEIPASQLVPETGPLFSWVTHGAMYWQRLGDNKDGVYVYQAKGQRLVVVSGDLVAASGMIANEADDVAHAKSFLETRFAAVMVSLFGPRSAYVLTAQYVRRREALPAGAWYDVQNKDEIQNSQNVLKKYAGPSKTTFDDGKWTLSYYVTLRNGSIEQWNFRGCLSPFSLDEMRRVIVEKDGTVLPMPEV